MELTLEYLQRRKDEANYAYDSACWGLHGVARRIVETGGRDAAERLRPYVEKCDAAELDADEAQDALAAFHKRAKGEPLFEGVQ